MLVGLAAVLVSVRPWSGEDQQLAATSPNATATSTPSSTSEAPSPATAESTTTATVATSSGSEDGSATPDPQTVAVPQNGNGKISPMAVPGATSTASGREVTYSVEIEGGLKVDGAEVAATIRKVLLDRRGWQKQDGVKLVALQPDDLKAGRHVDIRVTLASPGLTDKLCAPLRTLSQVSCWNGERSVLNLRRWLQGDDSYGTDVALYRVYQINHEFGHGLGHDHEDCPSAGKRAPVMMQQTLTLGACKPWPYPQGA